MPAPTDGEAAIERGGLLPIAAGAAAFLLLLLIPPAPQFTELTQQAHLGTLLVLVVVLALLFRRKGAGNSTMLSVVVCALFAMPLLYKWQFAITDGNLVGGLLPWSDASNYYQQALRLVNGLPLTDWGARRPLSSSFLSVAMRLTGGSFTGVLALLTLLNAAAVLVAARVVNRWFGAIGAAVYVVFTYKFYVRFAGTTLSEQLGFLLGNLALFFLMAGVVRRNLSFGLLGLGLLTFGLNARAGAFVVLPLLVIWMAFEFRFQHAAVRTLAMGVAVLCIGFAANFVLVRVMAAGSGTAFSNYSYVLYGLASGNKGWLHVVKEHPNVTETEVMPLAVEKIKANPALLARGMTAAVFDYFRHDMGAFSFIYGQETLKATLWILVFLGIAHSARRRFEGTGGLATVSLLGVIASLPLLPPIDSDGMRVFATTIPFCALWIVAGIRALAAVVMRMLSVPSPADAAEQARAAWERSVLLFAATVVAMAALLPPLLLAGRRLFQAGAPPAPTMQCDGSETIRATFFDDTTIVLIPDGAARESFAPYVRVDDFLRSLKVGPYSFLDDGLRQLTSGDHLSIGFKFDETRRTGTRFFLISDFPVAAGSVDLCGQRSADEQLQRFDFYNSIRREMVVPPLVFSQRHARLTSAMRVVYGTALVALILVLSVAFAAGERGAMQTRLVAFAAVVLVAQGLAMFGYVHGIPFMRFNEQSVALEATEAVQESGHAYQLSLGTDWMDQSRLGLSPAKVLENGVPLPTPNAMHAEIREKGSGRYSLWGGALYFSSSDNTDPRTNGRAYTLVWPRPVGDFWKWISYLLSLVGIAAIAASRWPSDSKASGLWPRLIESARRWLGALQPVALTGGSALGKAWRGRWRRKGEPVSLASHLFVLGATLLVAQAAGMYWHMHGESPFRLADQRVVLKAGDAVPELGHAYLIALGTDWMDQSKLGSSPAVVLENGVALAVPNAMHQAIRDQGKGRYSLSGGWLYFSASDNSDPRANGRTYEIVWPYPFPARWQTMSYSAGSFGLFGLVVRGIAWWKRRREPGAMSS